MDAHVVECEPKTGNTSVFCVFKCNITIDYHKPHGLCSKSALSFLSFPFSSWL